MRSLLAATLTVILGLLASPTSAFGADCSSCASCRGCKCIEPPCPSCPDCSDACSKFRLPALGDAQCYIDKLTAECCADRIKAVKKLGHPLHANICCNSAVLDALIRTLLCDECWEVRKAAAWALLKQKARVCPAVVALYISSKIDRHYMVRDASAQVLDILILCRNDCYKDQFKAADELIKAVRRKPICERCEELLSAIQVLCAGGDCMAAAPVAVPAMPAVERIPLPKGEDKKEEKKEEK